MFEGLKGIGSLMGLLGNPAKLREQAAQMNQRLSELVAEGDAGGGMVKVRINGNGEVLAFTVSDDALLDNDREMLEDLLRAATNQALQKMRRLSGEEYSKLAVSLGLPPGTKLPGLEG
jgi:DNA-binding YbaB/EbfC family protein